MAHFLKLAELFKWHGMTQMNIWRSGINPKLDPQRTSLFELLLEFLLRNHLGSATHNLGQGRIYCFAHVSAESSGIKPKIQACSKTKANAA
jgi:hypothetical protein